MAVRQMVPFNPRGRGEVGCMLQDEGRTDAGLVADGFNCHRTRSYRLGTGTERSAGAAPKLQAR